MGKISFVIVHGIGDEKPGEITNKWLSKISPSVLKKLNKREREAFKSLENLPKSEFQNIGIGSVSLVEPRWELREPGSFSVNWKILLYVLPLVFFNITSFVSSRENQLKILSDDTVSGLENLRVKYATLWLLFCLPAIIYGFYLVFGLLWCLFVLSLIAVIFCGMVIAKKFNPFLLIGQVKSAALARSSFLLVELVRLEIEKSIKCSDKVIVIAHSQGGYLAWRALKDIEDQSSGDLSSVKFIMVGSGLRAIHWISKIAESKRYLVYFNIAPVMLLAIFLSIIYNFPEVTILNPVYEKFSIFDFLDIKSYILIILISLIFMAILFILGNLLDIKRSVEAIPIPKLDGFYEVYSLDDIVARSRVPELSTEPVIETVPSSGIFMKDHSFSYYLRKSEIINSVSSNEILSSIKKGFSRKYRLDSSESFNSQIFHQYKMVKSGFCLAIISFSLLLLGALVNFKLNFQIFSGMLSIIWIPAIILLFWNLLDFVGFDKKYSGITINLYDYNFSPMRHILVVSCMFAVSEIATALQGAHIIFHSTSFFLILYILIVNSLGTVFAGNVKKLNVFKIGKYCSFANIIISLSDLFKVMSYQNVLYNNFNFLVVSTFVSISCVFGIVISIFYLWYFAKYNKDIRSMRGAQK